MSFWQVDATSNGIIEDHIISLLRESQDVLVVPRFSSKHVDSSWLIGVPYPKSSTLIGFSIINPQLLGYTHLWKPPYPRIRSGGGHRNCRTCRQAMRHGWEIGAASLAALGQSLAVLWRDEGRRISSGAFGKWLWLHWVWFFWTWVDLLFIYILTVP